MADIDEGFFFFFSSPCHEFLDRCTKEQLLSINEHYEIVIKDKRLKENVKVTLKTELIEKGLLGAKMENLYQVHLIYNLCLLNSKKSCCFCRWSMRN